MGKKKTKKLFVHKKLSSGLTVINGSLIESAIPVEPDPTMSLASLNESNQTLIKWVSDHEAQETVWYTSKNSHSQYDVQTFMSQNNLHVLIFQHIRMFPG